MVPVFLCNEPEQLSAFDDARNILSLLHTKNGIY